MRDLYFEKHKIKVNNELNNNQKRIVAYNVANCISEAFNFIKLDYFDLFSCLYNTKMYKAEIPSNVPQALYSYKNRSLYFSANLNLNNINSEILQECIHRIQDDTIGRIGLCNIKTGKGLMLNEVANQYIVNKILNNKVVYIENDGMRFNTYYENDFLMASNLIEEIVLLVGDNELINGTLLANNSFSKYLKAYFGSESFDKINNNLDNMLYLQNDLKKSDTYSKESKKSQIRKIYYETQELIYNSYYNFQEIYDTEDAKIKLNLLDEKFKNTESYETFLSFYKQKKAEIQEIEKSATSLIVINKDIIKRIFSKIKLLNKLLNLGHSQNYNE